MCAMRPRRRHATLVAAGQLVEGSPDGQESSNGDCPFCADRAKKWHGTGLFMRRSVQFHLERNAAGRLEVQDVERALDERLFSGGTLNLKLLGAEVAGACCSAKG